MIKNKKYLYGLDHIEYEHPFDRKALSALESTPGLGVLGKFVTKNTIEKMYTIQYTGSAVKVTQTNYPRLYEYLEYACQILDLPYLPELYVQWGYDINACTIGAENPIIVLNSGLIDLCDDDEILFIIGHECGHIKSNHMLYHMIAQVINYVIDQIPGGTLVAAPLQYDLFYWSRMSEFTADRAGLLCCQNMKAVARAFIKMSGLPINHYGGIDEKSFIEQAKDFEQLEYESMNKIIKFLLTLGQDHPWTVMRTGQLIDWVNSGAVKNIMLNH